MPEAIYILCSLTSLACTVFLIGQWFRTRVRLLLWASVFFITQTVTNIALFIDFVFLPQVDLSILRSLITVAGLMFLVFGLIWETT